MPRATTTAGPKTGDTAADQEGGSAPAGDDPAPEARRAAGRRTRSRGTSHRSRHPDDPVTGDRVEGAPSGADGPHEATALTGATGADDGRQARSPGPADVEPTSPDASDAPEARAGATLDEADMAAMFDSVAPVYDRLNTFMTLGADDRWRRRACEVAAPPAAGSAIDVCCGTGKLAVMLAERVGPFGRVEAVDLSPEMIDRAADRYHGLVQVRFRVGNALDLPFEDATFDAATISFGLRNLPDFAAGFRELARVVKPGGRVVCLELSLPGSRVWARVYHAAFRRAAPLAAVIFGGSRTAYRYLPDSLDGFPSAEQLAGAMRSAGLDDVRFWRLSTGVVTIHRGRVPQRPTRATPSGG